MQFQILKLSNVCIGLNGVITNKPSMFYISFSNSFIQLGFKKYSAWDYIDLIEFDFGFLNNSFHNAYSLLYLTIKYDTNKI